MRKIACFSIAAAISVLIPLAKAATLPAGSRLEVRLSAATGSRVSHAGDRIDGAIVAPVLEHDQLILPEGARVSGAVTGVQRLGLGLRHSIATLELRFTSVQLPDGRVFPLEARVLEIEMAKEHVGASGVIGGIYPTTNLSSGASLLATALMAEPGIAAPMMGIKFLIARSPDPEIYFPAGTELILELVANAILPNSYGTSHRVPVLGQEDAESVRNLLATVPRQQTSRGGDHPSDLVNILILGDRGQISRAFSAAGWSGQQRRSVLTGYRLYHGIVRRVGYTTAPMANLRLNGLLPDFVYQKSLNTFSKRHHIRIWNQKGSDAWLGAATEDISYAIRNMHLTHATDPEIDNERAKVVNDLWLTGCVEAGSLISRDSLKRPGGYGTSIATDGRMAVLRLNDCQMANAMPSQPGNEGERASKSRAGQVLSALGSDLARSNPLYFGYSATKSLLNNKSSKRQDVSPTTHSSLQPGELVTFSRHGWQRPSVIDVQTVSAAHSQERVPALTVENQAVSGQVSQLPIQEHLP